MIAPPDDPAAADALAQPILRRFYDYWRERAAGRAMPTRADIDPVPQRPALVPYISLVELRPPPRRFFFRVFAAVAFEHRHDLVPRNLAWRFLEDVPVHNRKDETLAAFARAADTGRPAFLAWAYESADGAPQRFAAALLPLGAPDRATHILLGTYYSDTQHLMLAARNQGAPTAAAA